MSSVFPAGAALLPFVLHGSDDNAALMEFHRQLQSSFARSGTRSKGNPNFNPHVTLMYDELRVSKEGVKPVSWVATELVMMHSLVGQSRYIPIARWNFCGRAKLR